MMLKGFGPEGPMECSFLTLDIYDLILMPMCLFIISTQ